MSYIKRITLLALALLMLLLLLVLCVIIIKRRRRKEANKEKKKAKTSNGSKEAEQNTKTKSKESVEKMTKSVYYGLKFGGSREASNDRPSSGESEYVPSKETVQRSH
ncbi:hypothetical protein GCK32_008143 [Trichostrongylus colubriformis]|uniref:Uncharacterized protein n=1 Tax=Trichostrongylus colubriformis TaxID=6319 RepID=A0AAN8G3X7_TRICO